MIRSFALLAVLGVSSLAAAAPRSFSVQVSGKGAPVILIPGLACNGKVWDSTVARYRKDHELHVVTIAGFGGAPAIDGPLLPTVRAELADYIRAHGLHPIVVGHSLGGFLALWLAETEPRLLARVVVVDAVPFLGALRDPAATAQSVEPRARMMRQMIESASAEQLAQQNRLSLMSMVSDPKNVERLAAMGRATAPKALAAAMYEVMTTDLRPQLAQIRVPVLVLAAGEGQPTAETTRAFEAQYRPLAGHELAVAAKSRHFIMIDDPGFFFAQLDGALGK